MLDRAQIDHYRDHGYLVVERLFRGDQLDALRRATDAMIEASRTVTENGDIYDLDPAHSAARPLVRRIKDPQAHHPAYDTAMRAPALLDILEDLIGRDIRFDHSKLNFKPVGGGASVEWHQDWAFYPHSNDDLLAVGVMLDDCTIDNGPLLVIPGSHTGPVWDHHRDGRFCGALDPAATDLDMDSAVTLTAPAGSVSIHHVRMVHGSLENRGDRQRRLLLYSYAAVDAWPLVGARKHEDIDLAAFDAQIVRGNPTLTPRLAPVPVRLPLPRAENEGSIFEIQRPAEGRSFGAMRAAG